MKSIKSIALCSSSRFKKEVYEFGNKLKELGFTVYFPILHQSTEEEWNALSGQDRELISTGLTWEHFYKLRKADAVFIYNKDGYIGVSVNMEIGYSAALDIPIFALEQDEKEVARKILFEGYAATPEALVELIK